jgi:hypothetical protein
MNKEIKPQVGMGATTGFNGDCYPYTVIEVRSPKTILVQSDNYKVIEKDAYLKEGSLECVFTPNPDGNIVVLTKRKNGKWVRQGDPMRTGWDFVIGHRSYSRNPHF